AGSAGASRSGTSAKASRWNAPWQRGQRRRSRSRRFMSSSARRRAGRSAAVRQRFGPFDFAAQPVLLAAQPVELHLAVQRRRVDQGVLGGEVDAAAILAQYARQVVLLRPPQVLLERHLVVVVAVAAVAVRHLLADPAVAGQVDLADDGPARAQDGALDHVAELAHVARPRVAHELRERLVGDPVDALLARHLAVAQELADQERDILDALAQRRDAYRHHVDAVVEVLAHPPLGHRLRQLHVGGGDDAHVDLDAAVRAELLDLALLEHAEQLQLHVERDALDLVQEQRPAGRELDLPHPIVNRARERAALVAEELALEERVREGRAVDGDEAAALALALKVDGARRELLAGPRLAVDEDGRVVLRQHADGLEDLVHDAVAAHHVGEAVAVRELAAEVADLVEQPALLEDLLGGEEDLLLLERLGDVVARALLDRLDRALDAGVAGDHDHVEVWPAVADLTRQSDAVGAGDLQVHDRERELVLLQQAQRFGRVRRARHRVLLRGVELLELATDEGIVVHDENARFHCLTSVHGHSGRKITRLFSSGPSLRSRSSPPCSATTFSATAHSIPASAVRKSGEASFGWRSWNPTSNPARSRRALRSMPMATLDSGPTCFVRWRTATSKARERYPGSISTSASSLRHTSLSETVIGVPLSCARTWTRNPWSSSPTPMRVKESCVGWK